VTKIKKRALELLHLGYTVPGSTKKIFPKWQQCLAIAFAESRKK
jgi:hypothetical protein